MTPKCPFLKSRHILTPYCDSHESHLASKDNPFFSAFLWLRMCTTLLFECPWGMHSDEGDLQKLSAEVKIGPYNIIRVNFIFKA